MIRFLHTADLHLGKPFGRFPEDLRGRLREARHASIARLAAAARAHGAADILVAGDSFDSQTPAPATLRQALHAMAADPGLALVAAARQPRQPRRRRRSGSGIARDAPPNVRPLLAPAPVEIAPGRLCSCPRPAPSAGPAAT